MALLMAPTRMVSQTQGTQCMQIADWLSTLRAVDFNRLIGSIYWVEL